MLSFTASLLETIIVKTSVFAVTQSVNLLYYSGSTIYNYYYPTLSETDRLKNEIQQLRNEIYLIKDKEYNDISNTILEFSADEQIS